MANQDVTPDAQLRAIARVLGMPVERFFEEVHTGDAQGTTELLNLWYRLRTTASRTAALEALLRILDAEAD